MDISVITSKNKKELTSYILEQVKHSSNMFENQRVIVVIPEQFSSFYEENIALEGGFMKVEILTFSRLTQRLFDIEYINSGTILDESAKNMILYSLLNDSELNLSYFKRSRSYPGFAALIKKTITDMQNAGIRHEDLLEFSQNQRFRASTQRKLYELSLIYQYYSENLHDKGYIDQMDNYDFLRNNIENTNSFENSIIYFDAFASFSASEYEILFSLSAKAKSVHITLCMHNEHPDIFEKPLSTLKKLKKFTEQSGYNLNIIPLDEKQVNQSECLTLLADKFLSVQPKQYSLTKDSIQMYSATDIYDELEYAAVNILDGVMHRGLRYRDYLLVASDISSYQDIIYSVFDQYDIPVYVNVKQEIMHSPLTSLIVSALDIYIWNWEIQHISGFIKNLYTDFKEKDAFLLENYLIKWGINGKKNWEQDWDYENNEYDNTISALKDKLLLIINKFINSFSKKITAKHFSKTIYNILQDLDVSNKIVDSNIFLQDEDRDFNKQCYNGIMEILDQLILLHKDEYQSAEYFINLFKSALHDYNIGITPMSQDCVFLTSTQRIDVVEYDTVHLLGVNEGSFPSSKKTNMLLNDVELEYIKNQGYDLGGMDNQNFATDQYVIYNLLRIPINKLYVSWLSANEDGAELYPSNLKDKIEEIFSDISIKVREDIPSYAFISNINTAFNYLYKKQQLPVLQDRKNESEILGKYITPIIDTSNLNKPQVSQILFGEQIKLSPTMLQSFNSCPYKYFMAYGLKLTERPEWEYFSGHLGNLKHDILFNAMRVISEKYSDYDVAYEEILECCKQSANILSSSGNIYKKDNILEYIKELAVLQTSETIDISLDMIKNGILKPELFEVEFKKDAQLPQIVIQSGQHDIVFTGKIDRVDKAEYQHAQYYRIIDYKSSVKDIRLYKISEGIDIQLAAYAYAYHKITGDMPAGMYYITVEQDFYETKNSKDDTYEQKDKIYNGYSFNDDNDSFFELSGSENFKKRSILDQVSFEKIFDNIEKQIINAAENTLEGNFPVLPFYDNKTSACRYCIYNKLCGFEPSSGKYRYIKVKKDDEVVW